MRDMFKLFTMQLIVASIAINVILTRADAFMINTFGAGSQSGDVAFIVTAGKLANFAAILCGFAAYGFNRRLRNAKRNSPEAGEESLDSHARLDIVFLVLSIILAAVKLASYQSYIYSEIYRGI